MDSQKACGEVGHDWAYCWDKEDYTDNDMLYRRCRRCCMNGGNTVVIWNDGAVQELMGKMFEVAQKEHKRRTER